MTTDPKAPTENHHRHLAGWSPKAGPGSGCGHAQPGDASIYATFSYLMELLAGDYEVKVIPGVPSFCAWLAAARVPPHHHEPASAHPSPPVRRGWRNSWTQPGRFVLMKSTAAPRVQEACAGPGSVKNQF